MESTEFFNRDRDELLTAFEKQSAGKESVVFGSHIEEPESDTPAVEGEEPVVEEKDNDKAEPSAEEEGEDATPDKEGDEYVPEDESLEEQLRKSKGAMYEEREKRKKISKKVQELEDQVQTLLQDNKTLLEKLDKRLQDDDPDDTDDDYVDPEVRKLRKELNELKQLADTYRQRQQQETEQTERQKLEKTLKTTNNELEKEGYPGFQFALAQISLKVQELVADDPYEDWDTPEGWKKIYKEHVYPEMKSMFIKKGEEESRQKKIDNKKKAELAGSPGKSGQESEKDDDQWSYADYLKERIKRQL